MSLSRCPDPVARLAREGSLARSDRRATSAHLARSARAARPASPARRGRPATPEPTAWTVRSGHCVWQPLPLAAMS
jgi:hypothetical protein